MSVILNMTTLALLNRLLCVVYNTNVQNNTIQYEDFCCANIVGNPSSEERQHEWVIGNLISVHNFKVVNIVEYAEELRR